MGMLAEYRSGLRALCCALLSSLAAANAHWTVGAEPLRDAYAAADARQPELDRIPDLVVRYTNELRTAHGAQPTTVSELLSRTAADFADFMARTDRIGHTIDGSTPSVRAEQRGYSFCMVSENIAMQFNSAGFGTEELAQRFVAGWENSPGHRRNVLDPLALETGAAVARSARTGRYYAVQMFGRPKSAMVAFQIANRSGGTVRYELAGKSFELPARSARMHEQCRPAQLVMHGADGRSAVQPGNGDRFVVVQDRQGSRLVKQ
jgi:uncharacterized protein YkwD